MQSVKNAHLLRLIWGSPLFSDAFPPEVLTNSEVVLAQIKSVNTAFLSEMSSLLTQAMPLVAPAEINKLVQSIGSKIVPFCAAIVAGDPSETHQLQSVAMNISLIYWADQSMDGGDESLSAAVKLLNNGSSTRPSAMVASRLTALRSIEQGVETFSLPEDKLTLLQCGIQETLIQESRKRELNRLYGLQGESEFWAVHTQETADILLATAALINIVATMYAMIYRHNQPQLPSLPEVFQEKRIMEVLYGPYNAAIRLFDDLGDRSRDASHYPGWGEFNLNIFNQPQPELIYAFLRRAGLKADRFDPVLQAFRDGTEDSRAYIVQVFIDLIRDWFASLPAPIWEKYRVFLVLAKRVMEVAYVYAMEHA